MQLAALRIVWLCVSIYCGYIWPLRQYTVCFALLFSMSQSLIVFGSFRNMALLFVVTNLLIAVALWSAQELVTGAFVSRLFCSVIAIWMFQVWAEDAF